MNHVYLGWADSEGLKEFQPESEQTLEKLIRRTQDQNRCVAVWSVIDSTVLSAVNTLLAAADHQAAWRFLQTHATHIGRVL